MAVGRGREDGQAKTPEVRHDVEETILFVLRKVMKTRKEKIARIARCLRFASRQH